MRARLLLASSIVWLTACSALIGVNDLSYDENAEGGVGGQIDGGEGGGGPDGTTTPPGATDGGTDGPVSCVADLSTDPKNCGACGHDCFGGACAAGKCGPVELGTVTGAPLRDVVVSDQYVFVSGYVSLSTDASGIWRIPKNGGPVEQYVTTRYAEAMAIFGDTLYFVVHDDPENGTDQHGGVWSCPLTGASPCVPKLIAAADNPRTITVDETRLLYPDQAAGKGIMAFTPPGAPAVFRDGFSAANSLFVDGQKVFYSTVLFTSPQQAKVLEVFPDGGFTDTYIYSSDSADDGTLIGDTSALHYTAYDFDTTTSGVVRRIPRPGSTATPCDYGGTTNKRPYGVYVDATRVYWTNQGDGATEPYTGGTIASCPLAGCCATGEILAPSDNEPLRITGDGDAIYWVEHTNGKVWKMAKPLP
jgi:hypothetical protein